MKSKKIEEITPEEVKLNAGETKRAEVIKKIRKHVAQFLAKLKMRQYPEKMKGKIVSISHQNMSSVVVFTVKRLFFLKRKFLMDFRMCDRMLEDMGISNVSELHGEKLTYENKQIIFDKSELNPQY